MSYNQTIECDVSVSRHLYTAADEGCRKPIYNSSKIKRLLKPTGRFPYDKENSFGALGSFEQVSGELWVNDFPFDLMWLSAKYILMWDDGLF